MKLAQAPAAYAQDDQALVRREILNADAENFKKGRDVILTPSQRLVIYDEVTGTRYRLKIASGVLSIVTYP